jgi:UDP-glucose 4-epimerase
VVHAASIVHRPGAPADEYVRFNVDGTRALLEAARAAGARRFVFISSIKVHGEDIRGVIDEKTPVSVDAHYAQTKAEAERLVLEATDLRPVVLRLCPVFGRGDRGNVRTVIRAVQRRRFVVPGDGSTRKSVVHVSTVAKIVRAIVDQNATGTFVVADRVAPSIRELADTIALALGRRRPVSVPLPLVRGVAEIIGRSARRLRISTPISAELIDKSTRDSVCDPSRVERELGVDTHVDLRWAIEDEIAWLRSSGLL